MLHKRAKSLVVPVYQNKMCYVIFEFTTIPVFFIKRLVIKFIKNFKMSLLKQIFVIRYLL